MKQWLSALLILLSGCGSDISVVDQKQTRVVVDSYSQIERVEELDILIALDTSGSMGDNFDAVATGMEALRIDIESITLDYSFGYITMDNTSLGYIGPYDSNSTQIDMLMAPYLLPMTPGEAGFSATYSFLQSEDGLEFSRPDSDFLLFLISDEEEQSGISAEIFKEWLDEKFSGVRHDIVAIAQTEDSSCGSIYDLGYKYEELAGLYGKSTLDICEEDWSMWLSDSSYLTELRDYIELTEPDPIPDSLIVYVNEEVVSNWIYDESLNLVKFDAPPEYGALVEVGYNVYV